MSETLKLVHEIYGPTANANRALEMAHREADLMERRQGFWVRFLSSFGW